VTSPTEACIICTVISNRQFIERTEHGVIFKPDNPIVEGHLIAAPLAHVATGLLNPVITAQVMRMAAMKASGSCTLLMPVGAEAGQVHPHMYVHIVPAAAGQARFIKAGEVKARR
jgi:diadenosine tetraphosphate (Ap4A) HIT family hydrolase